MRVKQVSKIQAGAIATINLDALAENYLLLKRNAEKAETAGVVKADAYGMGINRVAPVLWDCGCKVFFTAHVSEGVFLRKLLPSAEIHILNGLLPGGAELYQDYNLIPVLGSLDEIARWRAFCAAKPLPCDIHVDTGMRRLGLPPDELQILAKDKKHLAGMDIRLVLSHFASADEEKNAQNKEQRIAFESARYILPMGKTSFANSAGIFLGKHYRGDVVRPGIALYGCNPTPWLQNPMLQVLSLHARVLQVRNASAGETVSYGGTYTVEKPTRIATVSLGYADGYLRSITGSGHGYLDGQPLTIIGRITMDLIMLDATNIKPEDCRPGDWVEFIGSNISVDSVAARARTISHEILTNLGSRYHRRYIRKKF